MDNKPVLDSITNTEHETVQEYYQRIQEENDILKDILTGATLTVSAISSNGENKTNEIFLSNLLKRHTTSPLSSLLHCNKTLTSTQSYHNSETSSEQCSLPAASKRYNSSLQEEDVCTLTNNNSMIICDDDYCHVEACSSANNPSLLFSPTPLAPTNDSYNEEKSYERSNSTISSSSNTTTTATLIQNGNSDSETCQPKKVDTPRYYKQDLLAILQERNEIKEERDNLLEELEEWKRAAIESQETVNKLETDLAIAQAKLGRYSYATEIEANALGILPKGTEFRPKVMSEVMEVYVTDVEGIGFTEQHGKFVFSIQLSWSNKRRFEIYRGYGEFFTFQNTLLLLFPEEAGKHKSERIIPSLPTADNVLAILGATNKKSIVESRLQLISDYCIGVLLNLPKRISRSVFVKDFFRAKPGDTQLESLERPKQHNLELSVYPLIPEGQSLGVYVAVSDFTPSDNSKNQISLREGENVKVAKEDQSGWWYVYSEDGDKCGYVPSSFLTKIGAHPASITSPVETRDILGFIGSLDHRNIETETHTTLHETETHTTLHKTETHTMGVSMYEYVAIDSYQTNDSRQFSFPEGAVLTVIEKSEDGWWFATYKNEGGWVPSTYLITLSQYNDTTDYTANAVDQSLTSTLFIGQAYVTIQSYTAQEEDELSLPIGVKVAVTEKSLNGWWQVRYKKKTGYVPAVILRAQTDIDKEEEEKEGVNSITAIPALHVVLSHSVSGIKKPPPRRKQLLETIALEKKRTLTLMEPVQEIEEPSLEGDGGNTVDRNRKSSIKEWFQNFRRKTVSETTPSKDKPSQIKEEEENIINARNNTFSTVNKHDPRPRSAHILGSITVTNTDDECID